MYYHCLVYEGVQVGEPRGRPHVPMLSDTSYIMCHVRVCNVTYTVSSHNVNSPNIRLRVSNPVSPNNYIESWVKP